MSKPKIRLPSNPAHQRFADLHLQGKSIVDSYLEAGFKAKSRKAAMVSGAKLKKKQDVRDYIEDIQAQLAGESVLSLREIQEFCARVVRTPITALDPDNDNHADLIKSFRKSDSDMGSSFALEKHDPFKAIDIHLKISGEDPRANAIKQLAEEIGKLGGLSPLPNNKL